MTQFKTILLIFLMVTSNLLLAQEQSFSGLKADAVESVEEMEKLTQVIVDTLFSYSELGFQEFETQRYLTDMLIENGFDVELGVAGIPSAWWAVGEADRRLLLWVPMLMVFRELHKCLVWPIGSQ